MDKMLKALNGNRGDAAFLSNKGLDSVRLKLSDDSLRCVYAWKTWLLHLCFGLAFGPGFTMIVVRGMQRRGQNLAGVVNELGYYFAIGGGLMIAGMWLFVFHTLLSRRYVEFDFKNGQIVFHYFGFGNFRYVVSLSDVSSVFADTIFRRESESHPARFNASHVLTLSLRDGRKIKVFETRNQDIARQAADIVDARLKADKVAVPHNLAKGYPGPRVPTPQLQTSKPRNRAAGMKLGRIDIVGATIANVYETEPIDDGFISASAVYVELSNGAAFLMEYAFRDAEPDIRTVELASLGLNPVMFDEDWTCTGERILEVVQSNHWPTFGLLLESGRWLIAADDNTPRHVGACLLTPGLLYNEEDVRPLWT